MKISVSPPKNKDLFYHEAQTARKARYIISGLQLLSGATALIGIRLYFSDWLNDMSIPMQYLVMAIIAFVLVAPGEMGIRETWAYLFRAVLNRYNKGLNLFSLILMGFVALFLTSYSFYLSQHATKSSMQRAAPKVVLTDTKDVSQSFNQEVRRISKDYETQKSDINKRYQDLINAENDYYDNLVQGNEAEVDGLRKKGWATGQRFTTKINALETKNRNLETKRSENIKLLKEKQNAELSSVESWRRSAESEAKEEKQATKSDIKNRNQEIVDENKAFAAMFSTLIARFAAWSVILVILFTGYLEIFYYKTGIKRVVKFKSTDFQSPVLLELLVFPYVYASRYLTNFVRQRYSKLPDIVPAPGTENLMEDQQQTSTDSGYSFEERQQKRAKKNQQKAQRSAKQKEKKSSDEKNENTWFRNSTVSDQESKKEPARTSFQAAADPPPKAKALPSFFTKEEVLDDEDILAADQFDFHQKDQEPEANDASELSDSLAEIFKRSRENFSQEADRTSLDDLDFGQEIDYNATIKHVDRRSGHVEYFSMDDLDSKIGDISSKMDDASEMYQDTGDPIYLASIEEYRKSMEYWQTRRVELHQRMHSQASF